MAVVVPPLMTHEGRERMVCTIKFSLRYLHPILLPYRKKLETFSTYEFCEFCTAPNSVWANCLEQQCLFQSGCFPGNPSAVQTWRKFWRTCTARSHHPAFLVHIEAARWVGLCVKYNDPKDCMDVQRKMRQVQKAFLVWKDFKSFTVAIMYEHKVWQTLKIECL